MERPHLLIVGLGGSGIAVLNSLPKIGRRGIKVLAADVNDGDLKHYKGRTTFDLSRGTTSKSVAASFASAEGIILVSGLGGATGAAAAVSLAAQAAQAKKRVGIVALMPFPFEPQEIHERANAALAELEKTASLRTVFRGEELLAFIHPSQAADEAWYEIDLLLADTVAALSYSLQELGHNHSDKPREEERRPWEKE
jgi:cell division GTPase FtsZ